MKKRNGFRIVMVCLSILLLGQTLHAKMVHPGGWHTQADLTLIRAKVAAGEEPWITGWNAVKNQSPNADYKINPTPLITNNGAMSKAGFASWVLTMKWVASGDQAYADAAIGVINDWVNTVTDFDVYGPTLTLSTGAGAMAQAAEILAWGFNGEAGWDTASISKAQTWLKKVIYDRYTNTGRMRSTNWGTSCVGGNMSMAIFCDDMSMFEYQRNAYLYGYQDTNDGCTAVTDYIFDASGQAQESGRDQAHVQGGIAHLTEAALCAWNQGIDLVSVANNRLLAGVEYHAKYNLGYDDLPFTTKVYNPCNLPLIPKWSYAISEDYRGKFSPVYCMSAKLFTLAGLDHPYTKAVIASPGYAPEINNFAHPGLGTFAFVSTLSDKVHETGSIPVVSSKKDITVCSISELRVAMAQSNQIVTMTPATYTVKDLLDSTTVFKFSGSNNTFKFTGVSILIPTELLSSMAFNPIHAHVSYLFTGSNITLIDGTFEDVYPNGMNDVTDFAAYNQQKNYAPVRQMTEFKILGDKITLNGCKITVRGSYPYGYGDMWGKGRGSVVGLKKHAGINVIGTNCTIEGVSLSVLAFGHGIFMQEGSDNTLINNCTLQGRVRLGAEMYEEGVGSLPHRFDYTVNFGYLDGKAIPRNKGFALTEDGIRNYNNAGTLTVKNTRVTNFRGGMSLATGGIAHVENVDLVNCEHGYTLPGNSKIINCTGDASYGPVILCPYPQNSNDVYNIEIINRPSWGDHHLADIVGKNLKISFTYKSAMPETLRPIVFGEKQGGGAGSASNINITNGTPHPILIMSQVSNVTGTSCSVVTDNGTDNDIVYSPCKFSGKKPVQKNQYITE